MSLHVGQLLFIDQGNVFMVANVTRLNFFIKWPKSTVFTVLLPGYMGGNVIPGGAVYSKRNKTTIAYSV